MYYVRVTMLDQHEAIHYAGEPGGGAAAALALATKQPTEGVPGRGKVPTSAITLDIVLVHKSRQAIPGSVDSRWRRTLGLRQAAQGKQFLGDKNISI